jgi:hypothetical protein
MTRAKICYLHIGGEKTESTSIQEFLSVNRDGLADRGILYPRLDHRINHLGIAACIQHDPAQEPLDFTSGAQELFSQLGKATASDFRAFYDRQTDGLRRAVEKSRCDTLILSSEHFQSRSDSEAKLHRLKAILSDVAEEVRAIFYIRRQDKTATSLYSTALRVGHGNFKPVLPLGGDIQLTFDYWRSCRLFGEVFGDNALNLRLFGKEHFADGDLISDFCQAVEIADPDALERPPASNPSLSRIAQRFLALMNRNRHERFGPHADRYRHGIIPILEAHYAGKGAQPPREQAEAFAARFAEDNEKIRERFFPSHPAPLFGNDFSMYPEEEEEWKPGPFMAFQVGATIAVEQQREIERLKAEIARLKAEKAE